MKIKNTKPYTCPNPICNSDLTKKGIIVRESGSQSHLVKYNSKGVYKSDEFFDGDTDYYNVYCRACGTELDIKLGDVWDTLPKTKIKLKK